MRVSVIAWMWREAGSGERGAGSPAEGMAGAGLQGPAGRRSPERWGRGQGGAPDRRGQPWLEFTVGVGDLSQEAEPKGQAAVSGEKAKPGDRKKPDQGHRGDAAAPKGKGSRKELEADSLEVPSR